MPTLLVVAAFAAFPGHQVVPATATAVGSLLCRADQGQLTLVLDDRFPVTSWQRVHAFCVDAAGAAVPVPFARTGATLFAVYAVLAVLVALAIRTLRGLPERNRVETYVPPEPVSPSERNAWVDPNQSPFS